MIVLPRTSMRRMPAGAATLPRSPTAAMRLSVTRMSPLSITSSPFIVIDARAGEQHRARRPGARRLDDDVGLLRLGGVDGLAEELRAQRPGDGGAVARSRPR